MRITINAGHSAVDPGACGRYSTEADVVRRVASELCNMLETLGHETQFVQEDDLDDVCCLTNDSEAEIFVSIHCNASGSGTAEGTETFYWSFGDGSYRLADHIQSELVGTLGTVDRGLKNGQNFDGRGHALYVLANTEMEATVLTELAFIDNREEEDLLNTHIDEIAQALCRGIQNFINGGC